MRELQRSGKREREVMRRDSAKNKKKKEKEKGRRSEREEVKYCSGPVCET